MSTDVQEAPLGGSPGGGGGSADLDMPVDPSAAAYNDKTANNPWKYQSFQVL